MKGGFYVSTKQAVIILFLFVAIVVFVGLMAGLIKETCPEPINGEQTTTSSPSTDPPTTPQEEGPWLMPFLPTHTVPQHYDLWFYPNFYFQGTTFQGREDLEILVTGQTTNYLIVHYKLMEITKTTVTYKDSGAEIKIRRTLSYEPNQYWYVELEETIAAETSVILHLEFTGSLVNGIVGYYKSNYTNAITGEESWLATTKFQPTDARKAFPNFDEPAFKATFTVTLRHWANFTALSNMPEESTTTPEPGWKETKFQKSVVMSSYLVCFIVCDFEYVENTFASSGITHRIWSTPDKINQTRYAVEVGKAVGDWFEAELDMDFHLPKLDQIAIPDYPSGATEHWGLITYRETSLLYNEEQVSASGKERVALVIAHELAHNYFGNLATCYWWDDIWLNEGFAKFYESATKVFEPEWELDDYFVVRTQQGVMRTDAGASSRPVVDEVLHPDQINQAFSGIIYDKGAAMLRMMEDFMGKDRFKSAVKRYLNAHLYGTVKTQDLWNAFNEELGAEMDIEAVMRPWTEQMGLPVVDITVDGSNIVATPKRFLTNPESDPSLPESPYRYDWYIPLSYYTESNPSVQRIWLNKTSLTFADPRVGDEWIKFNSKQAAFLRVNYPPDMWNKLSTELANNHETFETIERSNLVDDAFNLARATQLPYPTVLDLVKYMQQEVDYFPWRSAYSALNYIGDMLYGNKDYYLWRKFVRDLTENVMDELRVEDGGKHLDQMLRTYVIRLACENDNTDCLRNVTMLFQDYVTDDVANSIAPSIRQEVYIYGMKETGGEEEWNTLWDRYLSATSSQEELYLLYALAQTPNLWLIQRYLDYCMDPTLVRTQDFFTAVNYVTYNPVGASFVWDWTRENYDLFVERFGVQDRYFGRMVPNMVNLFKTEFQLKEVEAFYAKYPDAGAGESARAESLESIRSNIEWRNENENDVINWLINNVSDS